MPTSEVISARNSYAGCIRAGATPERIEQARSRLQYAKARKVITVWLITLTTDQRAELARLLSAGPGDEAQ
jgi:hypothetical protein